MNEVQELIAQLRSKGWTLAAVADELGVAANTLGRWQAGSRHPSNPVPVVELLRRLLGRRRVPKQKRYGPDAPQRQSRKGLAET